MGSNADHMLPPRGSCTRNALSLIVLRLISKDGTYHYNDGKLKMKLVEIENLFL